MLVFIKELFYKIKKTEFIKNIATLVSGVLLGQAITTIGMPIISRIYNPEVLGEFNIINSSGLIINGFLCLGLLTAIMIPEKDEEANGICKIITVALFLMSTFILLIVLVLSPYFRIFEVSFNYGVACVLLWLLLLTTNISTMYYSYVNRKKMYRVLFWNPTVGALSTVLIRIVLGLLGFGAIGYLIGAIASYMLNILYMARYVNPFQGSHNKSHIRNLFKKYSDFPLYQMPANIISGIAGQLPVLLIARFFGNAVVGSFSMALSILNLPINFLASPINRVYFRDATELYNEGKNIANFTFNILKTNIRLAFIPISMLIIFGEPLFSLILGKNWSQAGTFASVLGIYSLMLFCSYCLAGNFVILKKQNINLIISIVSVILSVISISVGSLVFKEAFLTIVCYVIARTLLIITDLGLFLYLTGLKLKEYFMFLLFYFIFPVAIAVFLRILIFN